MEKHLKFILTIIIYLVIQGMVYILPIPHDYKVVLYSIIGVILVIIAYKLAIKLDN